MRLLTGGYAQPCSVCGTPLLTDEEDAGVCDDCAGPREAFPCDYGKCHRDGLCSLCCGGEEEPHE